MKQRSIREQMWGPHASKFIGVPHELLVNYRALGLSDQDFIICVWVIAHQWNEKAAFPHPEGLADVLGLSYDQTVRKLRSLHRRGFMVLEQTRSNKTNYYQDLRPLRNILREFSEVKHTGIDTSINKSQLKDESLLDAPRKDDTLIEGTLIDPRTHSARQGNGATQIGDIFTDEWLDMFGKKVDNDE